MLKRKITLWSSAALIALTTNAPSAALAAPSAEVARKCMHWSYVAFPYKRPGSVKMSGDRQAYFKDCLAKEANVPEPQPKAQ
jgi:hypothetical protein